MIAAEHTTGYVFKLAIKQPYAFSDIVFIAPTWRGPLPTMGANPNIAAMVRGIVRVLTDRYANAYSWSRTL